MFGAAAAADELIPNGDTGYQVITTPQVINHGDTVSTLFSCPQGGAVVKNAVDGGSGNVYNKSSANVTMASYIRDDGKVSVSFTNWNLSGDQTYSFLVFCTGATLPSPARTKPQITVSAATADGLPYAAGTWAKREVRVTLACSANGQLLAGGGFPEGANWSLGAGGASCVDGSGQTADNVTFGPINIDQTPPIVAFAANLPVYTLDQDVNITCSARDPLGQASAPASGVQSNLCPPDLYQPAHLLGVGAHVLTASAIDFAGNIGTARAQFTVTLTAPGLRGLTTKLLGSSFPWLAHGLASILDAGINTPSQLSSALQSYRSLLASEAGQLGPDADSQMKLLSDFALRLSTPSAPTPVINDADFRVHYSGQWGYHPARPASFGDVGNDVHATTNNGDGAELSFQGSSVSFLSELSDGYGFVDVYLDGALDQIVDINAPGVHNRGGQLVYERRGLSAGTHSLRIVKRSGVYSLVDGFIVTP